MSKVLSLQNACNLAVEVYTGKSGYTEHYIAHIMAAAIMLADAGASSEGVLAGILWNAVDFNMLSIASIEKQFGKKVSDMILTCQKLNRVLSGSEEELQNSLPLFEEVERDVWLIHLIHKSVSLRSFIQQKALCGEKIWPNHNKSRKQFEDDCNSFLEMFWHRRKYRPCLYAEVKDLTAQLFAEPT